MQQQETQQAVVQPEEEARDAVIQVLQQPGNMSARVVIDPPVGAGLPPTRDMLDAALQKAGIVYGLDEEAIASLLAPVYGQQVTVARGLEPQDGEDGICTELYPREVKPQYKQREDGTVDYRELDLIIDLPAGTTICEISAPTNGTDGVNVMGQPLKARDGKKASVPIGEGTRLADDGLGVVTTVGGSLVFRGGRFCVDKVYRVQNVDYDTGNIVFSGDVVVNEEFMDGFSVRSGGSVTLRGRVGAVTVQAAQDINVDQGVNGTGRAVLEAGKVIKAGFIENCIVRAGEKIIANSIINSKVECDGDIEVTGKKGLICGGKITAFGSVKANEVGNTSNTLTQIVLGVTPRLLEERRKLNDQLADVSNHIGEMQKNIAYIERLVADGRPIPPERVKMLQRIKIQMPMSEKKQARLKEQIAELAEKMAGVAGSTLTARIIHPPTRVTIGAQSANCVETRNSTRVYKNSEGEVVFGSA